MLLNNEWVKNEIKEEIKRCLDTNENEYTNPKPVGQRESNLKKEIHGITCLSTKRKAQINNLTLHLKETEKEQQTKPK